MEYLKVVVLFVVCVFVCPSLGQEQPPACVTEMMQEPGFMECMTGFMGYMTNQQEALAAAGPQDETAMMKIYCSDEGKAAMTCMMKFIQNCPEISSQAGGMDFTKIFQQGGLDAACSIMTGPCSKIQECLKEDEGMEMGGPGAGGSVEMSAGGNGGMTMNDPNSNAFASFVQEAAMACGPMKKRYDCMMKHLDKCRDEVKKLEEMLKQMADAFMKEDMAIATYDEMKKFMKDQCPKVPANFGQDQCIMTNLMSMEYKNCYQNASDMAMKKEGDKCGLYDMQSDCLNKFVGTKCGEEKANFMKDNMNIIIKDVPYSCTIKDTSGADRTVMTAVTTLVMLALSVLIVL